MSQRTFMAALIAASILVISGASLRAEAAGPPVPTVSEVHAGQSNISGVLVFHLYVNGTSEGRASKMNFTLAIQNDTAAYDGPWIDPLDLFLFGNGISFRSLGDAADPWSRWGFHLQITYDISKGPQMMTDIFAGWLGINMSDVDPGQIDGSDLEGARAFFKVRAYDAQGGFGEATAEITDELEAAFVPKSPSGGEGNDDGSGEDLTLPILLISFGAALILIALVFFILRYRRKGAARSGLGYTHERL